MRVRLLAVVLFLLATTPAQKPTRRPAAPPPPPPPLPALGEGATNTLVHAFGEAEHWALQAIVLLSLGHHWHPAGVEIVLAALRSKDERLQPYGVEVLRHMDGTALAQVGTQALVAELIDKTLREKNKLLQARTLEVLGTMLPDVGAKDRAGWQTWWSTAQKTYAPPAWTPAEQPKNDGRGTTATTIIDRAFDLRDAGLDLAIVIDSTGSMQVAIDTARDAIDDVVALLAGVAPKLRLGLVHYKDLGDFGEGAQLLVPMTKDQNVVRERLAHLTASGGGDMPERVERGIEVALGKEMAWNKEANRMILVIGDAPPHPEDLQALCELVKKAHDQPFDHGKNPTTGQKQVKYRPFITSAIATSRAAKAAFDDIAKAGGGASVELEGVRAPKKGEKPNADAAKPAIRQVVEHIMLLSFGSQYQVQLQIFVDTFFDYREAGLFR